MNTLPLPKVLSQRRTNSLDAEKENFERFQNISISKAINNQETPVKEKHVRNAIIGTFHEKGAGTFWIVVNKLPLKENPIVCWKFCHVLHKVLREGHQRSIYDALKYRNTLIDLGKMWGLLMEGYGRLIQYYSNLLVAKLDFHRKNPRFPGNLSVSDEELDEIGERDVNVFFQLCCEMFDYMDEILTIQVAVFGSLDMSRSNSMTNSGQCRLAPLIPCIQDSSQLYDYSVKVLFKLHAALPPDTLVGHRERFLKQFKALQQFYLSSSNLQYFKYLIQVPLLPENPPNFLVASELNTHVSPVVILPPQADTPDNESIDMNLVDTSVPHTMVSPSHLEDMFNSPSYKQRNGSVSPDQFSEKDVLTEQLLKKVEDLQMEIQRLKIEYERNIDDCKRQIAELESQIADRDRIIGEMSEEVEQLKDRASKSPETEEIALKLADVEKKAKIQEDKFHKMKEVYTKLREEHIVLIRMKAEVDKQHSGAKCAMDELQKEVQSKLNALANEKAIIEEKVQKSSDMNTHVANLTKAKEELETSNKSLQKEIEELRKEKNSCEQKCETHLQDKINIEHKLSEAQKQTTVQVQLYEKSLENHLHLLMSAISESEHLVETALDECGNPVLALLTCTPEYLLHQSEKAKNSLNLLGTAFTNYLENSTGMPEALKMSVQFGHELSLLLLQGKITSQSSPNIEQGDELASVCKKVGTEAISLFKELLSKEGRKGMPSLLSELAISLEKLASLAEKLAPNMALDQADKLGDLVQAELTEMDKAIEEAAERIVKMLNKTQAADSGIKLEVNGKILDACIALMQAIKELVRTSKNLQEEIVSQGQGSASAKEFYNRNHRWTEGLISAAKVVGFAAKFLVDASDKVVNGNAKFEELMVASQEIAAATAQLVVASKVKAARESEKLVKVSKASKKVTESTANVVATAKSCAQLIEESDVMDFSKLTLHQAKRLEMDSQVRVLELESSLTKERVKLAGLRKRHYHLAGASEGWEVEDIPQ